MKVRNRAPYRLIAFGFHTQFGYGDDVEIPPGKTVEVSGPYVGVMGGGSCYVELLGRISCQQFPNNAEGFQVVLGKPFSLSFADRGITVRHYDDMPEEYVLQWRERNPRHVPSP
ncbi:MAG: hypothetical protein WAW13_04020 [Minisyncoccia bacterium]